MIDTYDIVVAGGGPAGCVTALRLVRLGYTVALIESQSIPRPHIGESITVGVHVELSHLGLAHILDRCGRMDFHVSQSRWTEGTWIVKPAPPGAGTVNRGLFDAALLEQCRSEGVEVMTGRRVRSAQRDNSCGWQVKLDGARVLGAAFLVDATGRRGILPKVRQTTGARTIALYAYWYGDRVPTAPQISACKAAWSWGAPVDGLGFNITLFVDREAIVGDRDGVRRAYIEGVDEAHVFNTKADLGSCSDIGACDATAWFDKSSVGRDFIKVGEAAQSLDPLASMGIQKAIQTAIWASVVINTMFRRSAAGTIAREFYRRRLSASAAAHAATVAEIYASAMDRALSTFWIRRSALATRLVKNDTPLGQEAVPPLSSHIVIGSALVIDHPCICGDFVEMRRAALVGAGDEPVAFVGGLPLGNVIDRVGGGCSYSDLQTWMTTLIGGGAANQLTSWLLRNEVIRTA